MYSQIIEFVRSLYPAREEIPLHEPVFSGREKEYVADAIDSTFVSTVGRFVGRFEEMICDLTAAAYAIATVNGTAALHAALRVAEVGPGDEVITQPLSFVATANAIWYCGAKPVFLDVEKRTLGLSPDAVERFLLGNCSVKDGVCLNRATSRRIAACVPMHTFGHPCRIDRISEVCSHFHVPVIEDAAQSLGSTFRGKHAGTFGLLGIYSFNGNKTVTAGGGGAIVTNRADLAARVRHLTTTAKVVEALEISHDSIGYNYRMPNINAAIACAQIENIPLFIENKRALADKYASFFGSIGVDFFREPEGARSNYWLNTILLPDRGARDALLRETQQAGIMTRPAWRLLNRLEPYKDCQTDELIVSRFLQDRIVNLPSGVRNE